MQIKYGTSRIALLIPLLGIAIKFPRIYGIGILKRLYSYFKQRDWRMMYRTLVAPTRATYSVRSMIFGGILCNISEFWFYLKTQNKFAQPTYFSFFGLFNIQKFGESPSFRDAEYIYHSIFTIGRSDIKDGHCFFETSNFVVGNKGGLYLIDYASSNSQVVLQKHEKELCSHFVNYLEEVSKREILWKDQPLY